MRLVTLNSWKGEGAYARRLGLMAEELAALAPDIVVLQEVFAAPALGLDTAMALAAALAMDAAALPLRHKPRTAEGRVADSSSGLAVLSRWPILRRDAVRLTVDPRDGERAALLAEVDSGAGRVTVAAVHLSHLTGADALRRRQFSETASALAGRSNPLIAGDFNAPVEDFALERTAFTDSRTVCGEPPRTTLVGGGAGDCIDHVLFARAGAWRPVGWCTALNSSSDGITASDHCAVVVDFTRRPLVPCS